MTVFHDGSYWVAVLEEAWNGRLKAARHLFGKEPSDAEMMDFVLHHMNALFARVTRHTDASDAALPRRSPKRLAREAAAELKRQGASTRAQEALKLELEHRKQERRIISRAQREALKERKRELARMKAKARHRGR